MFRKLPLTAAALASVSCGSADFSAALRVTIEDSELTGGGYWIEMRRPDGATIDGLARKFVEYVEGDQEVAVILDGDGVFDGNDSRTVRLIVDAVAQRDAPLTARGAALVEIDRAEVKNATVKLASDPRPLAAGIAAAFDGSASTITVDASGVSAPSGFFLDLWLDAGERRWLGRLTEPVALDFAAHRAVIAANGLTLVVTAEPDDSPSPLVASSGWQVLRGELHEGLVHTLITSPVAEEGILAGLSGLVDLGVQHIGFALDAQPNEAEVRMHCEHVFSALGGAAVAEEDTGNGLRGDFNSSGTISWAEGASTDQTGVGLNTSAAPGYLQPLFEALSSLETLPVSDAFRCATNLTNANVAALAAVEDLAGDPTSTAVAASASAAVNLVRGVAWVDGSSTDVDQTTLCVIAELESIADFELSPVSPN